ncbi:MAG: HAMP domain-containing histidine kinase [Bacteroidetes Order II. Incertae sedis bacterium]|nr:HAMP domain-containing histidine kinase [Bacteroidetes Order II. bacterium]
MPSKKPLHFRTRLVKTLLPTFLGTLLFIFVLTAGSIVATFHFSDRRVLEDELAEISAAIQFEGRVVPPRYHWTEPHHTHAHPRQNPQFVQLFRLDGTLLFASDNVDILRKYPRSLVKKDGFFTDNRTGYRMLFLTRGIYDPDRRLIGYIQIGQYEVDRSHIYGLGLIGLAVIVLVAMIVWWFLLKKLAHRATESVEIISDAAQKISLHTRDYRIPSFPGADVETLQLTETLNDLLSRLQKNFDEMEAFTAHAAHELQTPITALVGAVEVALRRERTAEHYRETLKSLHVELGAMRDMVRSLLELARLEHTADETLRDCCDLSKIVLDATLDIESLLKDRKIVLKMDIQPDVQVVGDNELLKRMVENILDNAQKYTESGTIEVRLDYDPPVLLVRDTGLGIRPEDVPHVGKRFFRAKSMSAKGIPGSGLGMALVNKIAQKHHAQWSVSSIPNKSTTVTLYFQSPKAP